MKTLLCDRIEGTVAVLFDGDGREVRLPLSLFDGEAREGDVVRLRVYSDRGATLARKEEIRKKFKLLLNEKGEKQ